MRATYEPQRFHRLIYEYQDRRHRDMWASRLGKEFSHDEYSANRDYQVSPIRQSLPDSIPIIIEKRKGVVMRFISEIGRMIRWT